MKIYLGVLYFSILLSSNSFAQDKCELTKQTDEFTGAKSSETKVNNLMSVFPILVSCQFDNVV